MRPTLLITALTLTLSAAGALGKTNPTTPAAATPVITLPQAYSGYSEPEIAQCQTTGPLMRQCTVPAMTAGRYVIKAAASATSTGANATQSLQIRLAGAPCAATAPAPFTGKQGLLLGCVVSFLTDQPIVVSAVYATQNGTPDPKGPQLVLIRLPWNGIVEATPLKIKPQPAPAK
jgi:hypothetical protein